MKRKFFGLRKQCGMSQEELAGKLNVSRQAISRWEMGTAQPDVSNILQLSKLFQVTTDYLLDDECEQQADVSEREGDEVFTKKSLRKKVGMGLCFFGMIGNLIIYLFSRFVEVLIPYITEVDGRQVYEWGKLKGRSYYYFMQGYQLEFLTALLYFCIVIGICVFFMDKIKKSNKFTTKK